MNGLPASDAAAPSGCSTAALATLNALKARAWLRLRRRADAAAPTAASRKNPPARGCGAHGDVRARAENAAAPARPAVAALPGTRFPGATWPPPRHVATCERWGRARAASHPAESMLAQHRTRRAAPFTEKERRRRVVSTRGYLPCFVLLGQRCANRRQLACFFLFAPSPLADEGCRRFVRRRCCRRAAARLLRRGFACAACRQRAAARRASSLVAAGLPASAEAHAPS